jgi:hypothetical protein
VTKPEVLWSALYDPYHSIDYAVNAEAPEDMQNRRRKPRKRKRK